MLISMAICRLLIQLFLLNFGGVVFVACLFEQCNHAVNLMAGEKVYISSPYYPQRYPLGTSCRYTVIASPQDQHLSFKCKIHLNVPTGATRCRSEVFYFNREGSELFSSSEFFCGSGEMERKSFLNRAVISYVSNRATTTGTRNGPKPHKKFGISSNKVTANIDDINRPAATATKVASNIDELGAATTDDVVALVKQAAGNFQANLSSTNATLADDALQMRTSSYPPPIELGQQESNSVAYIVGLLSKTSPELPNLIDDKLAAIEEEATTVPAEPAEPRASNASQQEQHAKIVNPADGVDGSGGGRFTCLVEVLPASTDDCDCGWSLSQLKLAGVSSEARINEFTSMAGIMTQRTGSIFCGGIIIHQRYVLSAAHCFVTPETNRSELLRLVVGEHDTSTVLETIYTRYHEIESIMLHEDFRSTLMTLRHDVALLRTRLPIEWNRSVAPACLPFTAWTSSTGAPTKKPPYAGQRLQAAGWGTISFGGPQSTRLLKTALDVLGTERCRRYLQALPPSTFCTFTPGSDTCQYDSGGGLYARRGGRLFAVGIVSYGYACASQQPSVNVRVASYLKWIRRHSPEVKYCRK